MDDDDSKTVYSLKLHDCIIVRHSIRKKLKLTQAQMAEQLDKSIKSIQAYEQGKKIPKLTVKVMQLLDKNSYARKCFLNEMGD